MRNAIGGFVGFLGGAFLSILLLSSTIPDYPSEVYNLWPLMLGGDLLHSVPQLIGNPVVFIFMWILIGAFVSPFSTTRWNTVRTSVWIGVFVAIATLTSSLLQDPTIWTGDRDARNVFLVSEFVVSLIMAQLSLLSALPLSEVITQIRRGQDPPIPEGIKTVCECGAVFKSKPILCASCGKEIDYDRSQDTDN